MVTMPIFTIVVYAIVMVGSMEKQPKSFSKSKQTENMVIWAFWSLFAIGAICTRQLVDGLGSFWLFGYQLLSSCRFTNSFAKTARRSPEILVRFSELESSVRPPFCGSRQ